MLRFVRTGSSISFEEWFKQLACKWWVEVKKGRKWSIDHFQWVHAPIDAGDGKVNLVTWFRSGTALPPISDVLHKHSHIIKFHRPLTRYIGCDFEWPNSLSNAHYDNVCQIGGGRGWQTQPWGQCRGVRYDFGIECSSTKVWLREV